MGKRLVKSIQNQGWPGWCHRRPTAFILETFQAIEHHPFEAIHPFVDGNGRIGRLLLSLLFVSWKLLPLPLLHLSAYIEPHRQEYYDLLLKVSQTGAWRDWILFFLRATSAQALDTSLRIKRIQDLQLAWHKRLTDTNGSRSAFQLADFLLENPILTIPNAQQVLGMSHRGAMLVVNKWVGLEILSSLSKAGHAKRFIANELLAVILG